MIKLNLVLKVTKPENESNWALWSRYYIGWPLANVTAVWAFLRDNSRPHLDEGKLPAWYKEIEEYLKNNNENLKNMVEKADTNNNESPKTHHAGTRANTSRQKMGNLWNTRGHNGCRMATTLGQYQHQRRTRTEMAYPPLELTNESVLINVEKNADRQEMPLL
jgi:hypothetical protein